MSKIILQTWFFVAAGGRGVLQPPRSIPGWGITWEHRHKHSHALTYTPSVVVCSAVKEREGSLFGIPQKGFNLTARETL